MNRLLGNVLFTALLLNCSVLLAAEFTLEADGSAPLYQTHLDKAI